MMFKEHRRCSGFSGYSGELAEPKGESRAISTRAEVARLSN